MMEQEQLKNELKEEHCLVIKRETIQRLIKDVKQLKGQSLAENNIYYHHDEENILKGYALIIGCIGTPYFGGYYLFELNYPVDYPHSPPIVTYLTNGDNIRFNPNLYTSGKVCISLLNTWTGEQWTSCQSITSVLLTLGTLLCNNPLLNEPGVRAGNPDCGNYMKIIEYKNIDIAVLNVFISYAPQFKGIEAIIRLFEPIMREKLILNRDNLRAILEEREKNPPMFIRTAIYSLNVFVDYGKLYNKFCNITNKL